MRWRQRRRSGVTAILICAVIALAATIGSGRALADDPKGFDFVDVNPATITPQPDGSFSTDVVIKNSGAGKRLPPKPAVNGIETCRSAKAEFAPAKGEKEIKEIENGEFAFLKLKISGVELPATCYVELETPSTIQDKPNPRSLKQFKLSQRFITDCMWKWLVATFCVAAVATFIASVFVFASYNARPDKKWNDAFPCKIWLGSPAWDFSKSWTSTLTLASAIVAAALAVSALPELTQHASRAGYGTLILLFSALALFAPLPYLLSMRGDVREQTTGTDKKVLVLYEGNGLFFFVTCLITLCAGLGQIAVFGLLVDEIFRTMYDWFWQVSSLLVVLIWICLLVYSIWSMWLTFELQRLSPETPEKKKGFTGSPTAGPGRPSWPLL